MVLFVDVAFHQAQLWDDHPFPRTERQLRLCDSLLRKIPNPTTVGTQIEAGAALRKLSQAFLQQAVPYLGTQLAAHMKQKPQKRDRNQNP